MTEEEFADIMFMAVRGVCARIAARQNMTERNALAEFYNSRLYSALERPETRAWFYSDDLLYDLWAGEKETGRIDWPEMRYAGGNNGNV